MDPPEQQEKQHGSAELEEDFTELEKKVSGAVPPQCHDGWMQRPTIYVVPGDLAAGNTDPYAPAAVCIGPFFGRARRVTEGMAKLERYKWCCVRKLIVGRRCGPGPAGTGTRRQPPEPADWKPEVHAPLLRRCVDAMTSLLPSIRASYSISSSMDTIDGGDDNAVLELKMLLEPEDADMDMGSTLAENMLLDGCFILHRLLKMARIAKRARKEGGGSSDDDDDWTQVYGRCGVWGLVTRDLLLLNNQIPLFVVRALLEQLKGSVDADEGDDVLVDGGLQLFSSLHPRRLQLHQPSALAVPVSLGDAHHLLHLFYMSITNLPVPTQSSASASMDKKLPPELTQWVPCAKELEDAGVRFRARKDGTATSFLDIKFSAGSGVLEIPPLQLYDYSEPLFRNLVAFEQTYPGTPGDVTAYAIFMDCLVKTSDDMRLLHRRGILLNHMNGDREAATEFFSRICAGALASADRNYLAPLMDEVVTYQRGSWPQWRAVLLRDYFGSPWAVIAVVVAAVVVALTMLQTFYALYAYYQPPKQS
ncbi:unnamed protein product [Miscanthus lutarioriparius]|uniref:Uncharacterized protein n=1 Tax=Miscanthus lutarioriparius TaxID=422564 RepID=A0A811QBA9_9POAL|nr:unnamed protein product [Miscanthus lutarioriparius]